MTLAWAGGIFIRYCKEDTCYTLVDLYCTFDSYIVYCGSSKKGLTALLTLADCVGSLNRFYMKLHHHFQDRFFSETGAGKHVPRCVMVDLDSGLKTWGLGWQKDHDLIWMLNGRQAM